MQFYYHKKLYFLILNKIHNRPNPTHRFLELKQKSSQTYTHLIPILQFSNQDRLIIIY